MAPNNVNFDAETLIYGLAIPLNLRKVSQAISLRSMLKKYTMTIVINQLTIQHSILSSCKQYQAL